MLQGSGSQSKRVRFAAAGVSCWFLASSSSSKDSGFRWAVEKAPRLKAVAAPSSSRSTSVEGFWRLRPPTPEIMYMHVSVDKILLMRVAGVSGWRQELHCGLLGGGCTVALGRYTG